MLKGDFDGFASACGMAGRPRKKHPRDFQSAIDEMYQYVMEHGGKAAKISGAGGGGFMMIVCDPDGRL
ncbi:MAG: hypothetical protein V8T36_12575 [Ruthenibacterium lactatiformans]